MIFASWIDKSSLILDQMDVKFLQAKLDLIMNSLGEKHLSWWEHKGSNQCRICDLLVICSRLLDHINSKSALDCMNDRDYQYNSVLDQEPSVGDLCT